MIWACLLAWAFSWIPKRLVAVGLIFLLGFACGQVTAYKALVHADRPAATAKAQRHSKRLAAKKGAEVARGSEKRQEPEPPPRLWYLPVAGS